MATATRMVEKVTVVGRRDPSLAESARLARAIGMGCEVRLRFFDFRRNRHKMSREVRLNEGLRNRLDSDLQPGRMIVSN